MSRGDGRLRRFAPGTTRQTMTPTKHFDEQFPPEIRVLLAGAQRRPSTDLLDTTGALVRTGIDWEVVEFLATRHAVVPLVRRTLAAHFHDMVPSATLENLGNQAMEYARHNFVQLQNLFQAVALLGDAGIPVITFKGLVQSRLSYGDTSTRWAGDIDLLVHESDFETARDLFVAAGFERLLLDPMEKKLRESGLWHEERQIKIDLHFGIGPDRIQVNAEELWTNRRSIEVGGQRLEGFGRLDNAIVLCINAVKEFWNQMLYRYCDLHEQLGEFDEEGLEALMVRARVLNCSRITGLALLVTYRLFETRPLERIASAGLRSASLRKASDELIAQMFYGDDAAQALEARAPLFLYRDKQQFTIALQDGRLYRTMQRLGLVFTPNRFDREFIRLPRVLSPLYYLVRPVRIASELACSLPSRLTDRNRRNDRP